MSRVTIAPRPALLRSALLRSALLLLAAAVLPAAAPADGSGPASDPVGEVDPLIGTGSGPLGYGRTMPLVTPPFGMTGWVAQTRLNFRPGLSYNYRDTAISGFMGTHQPALWMGDYGYVTIMPETGDLKRAPSERKLPFRHEDEISRPDYYAVSLRTADGKEIRAEMTASVHCAMLRFAFPAGANAHILVEAARPGIDGKARIDATSGEISGYNPDRIDADLGPLKLPGFKGYFVVQFSRRPNAAGLYPAKADPASPTGAFATFDTRPGGTDAGEVIEARIGTSFISVDQARENLRREMPDWDFTAARARLRDLWARKLGVITVSGLSPAERRIFYTALYHALLYPRTMSEYERYYSAFDDRVHDGDSYTDYSIWDIFRAEFSLLTITAPERIDGMIQALLQDYREGGWMPKWPNPSYTNIMIGTHADSLVAEAIGKGFHGFDPALAWEAVRKDATTPPDGDADRMWKDRAPHTPYEARAGLSYSLRLGYIPADRTSEAASGTLDDAYDDWCAAQIAGALGRAEDNRHFLSRALDYRNLFDSETGFMRARNADGSWAAPDAGWTEGSKWAYSFDVLHDIGGLIRLMGGARAFDARLDAYFDGGYDWHSNEPSHHIPYLYDFGGQPWKTQKRVREIMRNEYADAVSGLDGDDDCGQMSAWFVFSALGFYPVNPASGIYMIGSPLVSRAEIALPGGRKFTVIAENNSPRNRYIQSATLDGKPLDAPMIAWRDITAGKTLRLVLGPRPSRWGASWRPEPIATPFTDLSGTWALDPAASDYGDLQGPQARIDVIADHGDSVKDDITATGRHETQHLALAFGTTGRPLPLPPGTRLGTVSLLGIAARRTENALILTERATAGGVPLTVLTTATLSPDRGTMKMVVSLDGGPHTAATFIFHRMTPESRP